MSAGDATGGVDRARCFSRPAAKAGEAKLSTTPFCVGLPGAMQCHAMPTSPHQAGTAFDVSAVPLSPTIILAAPRLAIRSPGARPTRLPAIDVLTTAARHARVTSSTMSSTRIAARWQAGHGLIQSEAERGKIRYRRYRPERQQTTMGIN